MAKKISDAEVMAVLERSKSIMPRQANGQFAAGNPGGPGRPRRHTERAYLDALMVECPVDTWREVVKKAVQDARDGDDKARAWLSSYLVGRPEQVAPTLHQLAIDDLAGCPDGITEMEVMLAGMK